MQIYNYIIQNYKSIFERFLTCYNVLNIYVLLCFFLSGYRKVSKFLKTKAIRELSIHFKIILLITLATANKKYSLTHKKFDLWAKKYFLFWYSFY